MRILPSASAAGRVSGLAAELKAIEVAERAEAEKRLQQVSEAFREAGKRAVPEFRVLRHAPCSVLAIPELRTAA